MSSWIGTSGARASITGFISYGGATKDFSKSLLNLKTVFGVIGFWKIVVGLLGACSFCDASLFCKLGSLGLWMLIDLDSSEG